MKKNNYKISQVKIRHLVTQNDFPNNMKSKSFKNQNIKILNV